MKLPILTVVAVPVFCGFLLATTSCAMSHAATDTMSDGEAVQHLVVSERLYRVSHRNEELARCYAEDAHIHTSWQSGGRESFVGKTAVESQQDASLIVNRCNPPLVHLRGQRALVEYPMTTTREVIVNGERAVLTSYMLLIYRVEKRGGQWKIVDMYTINEFDELAPAIPGVDLKINPNDVKDLRASYRWLAYVRKLAGGVISHDLVGIDRPEGVKEIYDAGYKWLEGK